MQTKQKELVEAMELKTRTDGTKFTAFKDTAPKELVDLFLKHFEVRDTDYEIFSDACDIVGNLSDHTDDKLADVDFYELATDTASVYTADRLSYLTPYNQYEITDKLKEFDCDDIQSACAVWYDSEVCRACELLRDYILQ